MINLTKYAKKVGLLGIVALMWSRLICDVFFSQANMWMCTVWQPWFSNQWKNTLIFDVLYLKI